MAQRVYFLGNNF